MVALPLRILCQAVKSFDVFDEVLRAEWWTWLEWPWLLILFSFLSCWHTCAPLTDKTPFKNTLKDISDDSALLQEQQTNESDQHNNKLTEWWNGWSDITDHQEKKLSYGFCCVAKVMHYQCFAYSLCCFCCCWLFLVCWGWMTHCQSSLTQQSHCTRSIEFVLFFYPACHTDLHHNLCSHCGWKR